MSEALGRRLADAIDRSGLERKELGRRIGVTPEAIGNWLKGRRAPDAETLPRLAEALGVTTDELLGRVPVPPRSPEAAAPAAAQSPIELALESVRQGDWEAIARALAEALLVREHTELIRARDIDAVHAQSLHTAIEEARVARAVAANANGAQMDPAQKKQALANAMEYLARAEARMDEEERRLEPVPQE